MADSQNTNADTTEVAAASESPEPMAGKEPDWEGEFDADRAKKLVANLRDERDKFREELSAIRSKLSEKEESEKSEFQRLMERAERAEQELNNTRSRLLVAEVSREYGVPVELLSGSTREEIEAKAKALAEWAGSSRKPADDVPTKPKPKLNLGQGSGTEPAPDVDVQGLASRIREHRY